MIIDRSSVALNLPFSCNNYLKKRKNDNELYVDSIKRPKLINIEFDKIVVVELYSDLINEDQDKFPTDLERLDNELCGNCESGSNLANNFHPGIRFIYSNNDSVTKSVSEYAQNYLNENKIINLFDNNTVNLNLDERSKLIVVAQGNPEANEIADFNSIDFITTFLADLNVEKLAEIEFHVCMLGNDDEYLNAISDYFKHQTRIVSYPDLITTTESGEMLAFDEDSHLTELIRRVRT